MIWKPKTRVGGEHPTKDSPTNLPFELRYFRKKLTQGLLQLRPAHMSLVYMSAEKKPLRVEEAVVKIMGNDVEVKPASQILVINKSHKKLSYSMKPVK